MFVPAFQALHRKSDEIRSGHAPASRGAPAPIFPVVALQRSAGNHALAEHAAAATPPFAVFRQAAPGPGQFTDPSEFLKHLKGQSVGMKDEDKPKEIAKKLVDAVSKTELGKDGIARLGDLLERDPRFRDLLKALKSPVSIAPLVAGGLGALTAGVLTRPTLSLSPEIPLGGPLPGSSVTLNFATDNTNWSAKVEAVLKLMLNADFSIPKPDSTPPPKRAEASWADKVMSSLRRNLGDAPVSPWPSPQQKDRIDALQQRFGASHSTPNAAHGPRQDPPLHLYHQLAALGILLPQLASPLRSTEDDEMTRPVQRLAQPPGDVSTETVHRAAANGVKTPESPLPHLEQLQHLFEPHDLRRVRAHLGEAATATATAMNARAYATGDHVVFAGTPNLHTVAHETAHFIQQRAGAHPTGSVSRTGDDFERQADAVADRAASGFSVVETLDGAQRGGR